LRGKCRYCQQKISWQYPLVELATGSLFVLCFLFQLPYFLFLIVCFLIVIFVYDLKHYLIPDKIIYPAIVITLIYNLLRLNLEPESFSLSVFWAALGAAAFFGAIVLVSHGKWMGVGDIKLGFLIGLLLGWPSILVALFLAFMTGAIIGIGLILSNKKTLKSEVPFGPFLVTGTLVALFYGQSLINWYLNLL
jgi:prepilin signal peptidase PulO-like enzyme (type II secretory pathway)